MTVFVTGATGFIGTHFLRRAEELGWMVRAHCRPGSEPRLPVGSDVQWIIKPLDEISPADIEGCEALLHLAAHSYYLKNEPLSRYLYWNTYAAVRLVELAVKTGINRVVATGSSFEYGNAADCYETIPPGIPLEPNDGYSISKAAASNAFAKMTKDLGLQFSLLRLFTVFGEGQSPGQFWPSLKSAAESGDDFEMTPGAQIRDFTPVDIVTEELVSELLRKDMENGQFEARNLGSGQPMSLAEFAKYWWERLGASGELKIGALPYREGEVMRYVPEL
ncbi:MAG: NAD(P)-dependent oxidoreductase [Verrucomicrobiota bacterium]